MLRRRASDVRGARGADSARGLRSILEEILLNVMYHVPSDDEVAQVVVDADVVNDGAAPQLVSRSQLARSERRDKSA